MIDGIRAEAGVVGFSGGAMYSYLENAIDEATTLLAREAVGIEVRAASSPVLWCLRRHVVKGGETAPDVYRIIDHYGKPGVK